MVTALPKARTSASSPTEPRAPGEPRQEELADLVHAIAAGDHPAMARFFDATHALVFGLSLRLVGVRAAAEEVTLDVFMQVWRGAASYASARGRVMTWLLTIARSRALDRVRARATRNRLGAVELDEHQPADAAIEPCETRARAEHVSIVRKAVASLPADQRRAVELAFFGGLAHSEIAERLGEPLGTIKTRIRLGMIKLRDLLRPLEQLS